MNDMALESALRRLPEPSPPPGLPARALLRAARIEEEREAARRRVPASTSGTARRDRLSWAVTLTGLAMGAGAQVFALFSGESVVRLTPSPLRMDLAGSWEPGITTLVTALGIALWLAGLFGPADEAGGE
jgi:hypothetical protein